MHLPVFFDGQLLRCLIVGGGPSVLRKIEIFLESGASVKVVAPQADFKIVVLSSLSRVKWEPRSFEAGDAQEIDLVVIGSEDVSNKAEVVEEVRRRGVPVNVCGDPALSTIFIPAILREGDLTVAASSGGQAPFMAAEFVRRLGSAVKGWALWLRLAANFRSAVSRNTKDPERRREYYDKFIEAGPVQLEPMPNDKTSIAEWLQILHHTRYGAKPAPARTGFVPRSNYSVGYAAATQEELPPPDDAHREQGGGTPPPQPEVQEPPKESSSQP